MAYHSGSSYHRTGATGDNVLVTANAGYILGLIATNDDVTTQAVIVHDSENANTDPRPLLTLYLAPNGGQIIIDRPRDRGIEFIYGLVCKFSSALITIHLTTVEDEVL